MSNCIKAVVAQKASILGPLTLIVFLVTFGALSKGYVADAILLFEDIVGRYGALGQVFFVGVFFVAALSGVFPLSPLAVLGGVAYGLVNGFLLAAAGIFLGASGAFFLGRYALRSSIHRWIAKQDRKSVV